MHFVTVCIILGGASGTPGPRSGFDYERTTTSSIRVLGEKLGKGNFSNCFSKTGSCLCPTETMVLCSNFYQHSSVPLKINRLARDPERFIWALSIAQSRCISMQMRTGALVQNANMLVPYAGKFSLLSPLLISIF